MSGNSRWVDFVTFLDRARVAVPARPYVQLCYGCCFRFNVQTEWYWSSHFTLGKIIKWDHWYWSLNQNDACSEYIMLILYVISQHGELAASTMPNLTDRGCFFGRGDHYPVKDRPPLWQLECVTSTKSPLQERRHSLIWWILSLS